MKESLLENMNLCDLMFIKDAKVEKKDILEKYIYFMIKTKIWNSSLKIK